MTYVLGALRRLAGGIHVLRLAVGRRHARAIVEEGGNGRVAFDSLEVLRELVPDFEEGAEEGGEWMSLDDIFGHFIGQGAHGGLSEA